MTATRQIKLSEISGECGDYVDQVKALDPSNRKPLVIVEQVGKSLYIVDGFHRTAGMMRWCNEEGIAYDSCEVTVVVCDDAALIRTAAEPSDEQDAAIESIYELAGL